MLQKTVFITLLVVSLTGLSSCTTSGLEAIGKPNAELDQKHLVIHNDILANTITIQAMNNRQIGDLLEAHITLANLSSGDKNIQYRFTWFDKDDFPVSPDDTGWTPVTLHGAATVNLKGLAPNAGVTSYKLNVREQ